jgi:hypothetical protein
MIMVSQKLNVSVWLFEVIRYSLMVMYVKAVIGAFKSNG